MSRLCCMAVSASFSNVFKESFSQSKFSHDGKHLAVPYGAKVTVYKQSIDLPETAVFENNDNVDVIEWSPDSTMILCVILKRKVLQIWSIEDPQWRCKITEGVMGLSSARWSPDSRHVLSSSDFQIRVTIWSLTSKSISYLKSTKQFIDCFAFSPSGTVLAVAEYRDSKDFISIISCEEWDLCKNFEVATEDMGGLAWSPNGDVLCVWEAPIISFKLFIYDTSGSMLATYHAKSELIGIKSVSWHPEGQLLLVEGHCDKFVVLDAITWDSLFEWSVPDVIVDADITVYRSPILPSKSQSDGPNQYDVIRKRPYSFTNVTRTVDKLKKLSRPTIVKFSATGKHIACTSGEFPTVVFVIEVESARTQMGWSCGVPCHLYGHEGFSFVVTFRLHYHAGFMQSTISSEVMFVEPQREKPRASQSRNGHLWYSHMKHTRL
ncbi:WD repeat-containing protein WRAP73-like isoform X2 [Ornithodoros turicata]|uniref:WD repeat-containing protein WRAP73-like isoform X2 n=1 Tax=Ornithodoros turicata TaxID=34597 RepID=UPI00313A2104